jgi:hypothetical protein
MRIERWMQIGKILGVVVSSQAPGSDIGTRPAFRCRHEFLSLILLV